MQKFVKDSASLRLGIFHLTANCIVSEALASTDLDWLAIDLEASPADRMEVLHFLQSLLQTFVTTIARLRSCEQIHIEQTLDLGINFIIVPKVHDADICRSVVQAAKYPPQGSRGVNPVRASNYFSNLPGYFHTANQDVTVFVQIESRKAVENIEDILSIEGLDGIFVGCGDLAMDMGYPGHVDAAEVENAIRRVADATKRKNKTSGIFSYGPNMTKAYIDMGYTFIAIGNDIKILKFGIQSEIATALSYLKN